MKKILIAEIAQEVSTFNPILTDFELFQIHKKKDLINFHKDKPTQIGGAIEVLETSYDIVPTVGARATSAGPMSKKCWKTLSEEYINSITPYIDKIDGIYLSLHGAMQSIDENDPEGWIIKKTRKFFGRNIPIIFSMDLHGILTKKMISYADGFTSFHTYPHVDFHDTGIRAAKLLISNMSGMKFKISNIRIPALVRGDELITQTGCFGEQIKKIKKLELDNKILSGGALIGNPFTDVPELCSQIFFIHTKNEKQINEDLLSIAEEFWKNRTKMQSDLIKIDDALEDSKKI